MCDAVKVYESLEVDRIYNDASLLDSIIKDTIDTGFPQDEALRYLEQFQYQVIAPAIIIVVCILLLPIISIYLCFQPRIRTFNRCKSGCRAFYLIVVGLIAVCIGMILYFAGSIQNSLLSSACQFETSRTEAETLIINLNTSVVNITENLDDFVTKVTSSLGATPPSILMTSYTNSLDDLYNYASSTPTCLLPACQPLGDYYCSLCLTAEPVNLVSTFLQNNVQSPIEQTESFLSSIDTNFVQAKSSIESGLDSVSSVQTDFLSSEGTWGTSASDAIDFTSGLNYWYVNTLFVLLLIGLSLSIAPAEKDLPRLNCIGCLTFLSIVLFLLIAGIFVPMVTVSNDLCSIAHSLPDKVEEYVEINTDVLDIVDQCFGDGSLPEKYISQLDFVSTIGDCPTLNVNDIFQGIPSGSLNAVVNSMNSFTTSEINNELNPTYKQRMEDIMEIKRLNTIVANNENLLKNALGTSLDNVGKICNDIDPLFTMVKNEIYGFSCKLVGTIYFRTVSSFCSGVVDSTFNFSIVMYALAFLSVLFYIGAFGYFVSSEYDRLLRFI